MADDHLISLQPGTVLGGRYEVVKCLGAGSMGLVYACKDSELDDHMVAMKVLFPEVAQDKIAAARFRNEIFASYGVSHPNVVRAYEYLRDGDIVAYTMEYVGGGDLADRIGKDKELLSIDAIADMLSQMCLGVQAIHDAGIVHRDLKPENILLAKDGRVKIADFGIARTTQGPKLTEHGGVVGTIDYVSPEYMLNSHVDWRSDIYALGILAYEMTTHQSPFRGDSVYATMTKRLKTDPKLPSELRSEVPTELDQIILKAMARDPEARYQSAHMMHEDLDAYIHGKQPIHVGKDPTKGYQPSDSPSQSSSRISVQDVPRSPLVDNPSGTFVPRGADQFPVDDPSSYRTPSTASKMQSVLGRNAGELPDWSGSQSGGSQKEIRVSHGALDDRRIRRLSHAVHTMNRSVWVDVLTWVVAVVIGVGVGFFFIKVFFPELLMQRSESSITFDTRLSQQHAYSIFQPMYRNRRFFS